MFLSSRLNLNSSEATNADPVEKGGTLPAKSTDAYREIKEQTHLLLIEKLQKFDAETEPEVVREEIKLALDSLLADPPRLLSRAVRERLIEEIYCDAVGLGILEPLLQDDAISEIMVNNPNQVYIERKGKLQLSDVTFYDERHLRQIIDRIVSRVGRRIDENSPMCDARLPDGSRVNAIIPPLALDGSALTIRKFKKDPLKIQHLVEFGALSGWMAEFLRGCVEAKLNVLISGGTSSGKTTLLNVLSSFIPNGERLITIEDAAELQLQQAHVIRLETRPSNAEGIGAVSQNELLKNCLRMRPDRIILGEVRGGEALAMLQAMNTGHEGSLATIHANSTRDALSRLETMVLMSGSDLPLRAIREQMASALNLIIQTERSADGVRRVTSVVEIAGMDGDAIQTQEIFKFQRTGVDSAGKVIGSHQSTGLPPKCVERLGLLGISLPRKMFENGNLER